MVLTAACWPEEEAKRKLWLFLRSCEKAGVEPHLYGLGTKQFPSYRVMKLDMQAAYLRDHAADYTHVLYTDAWDAFFCGQLEEIVRKYESMGAPAMLSSAFFQLGNVSDEATQYPGCFHPDSYYRYPNVGGYLAEIPYVVEAFARMLRNADLTGDDCFEWYRGWKEGWFRPQLDSECAIFHISEDHLTVVNDRLFNTKTGTYPCILHLSGGYTDSTTGKDERLRPWAAKAGIL